MTTTKPLPADSTERLLAIAEIIENEGAHFNMFTWFQAPFSDGFNVDDTQEPLCIVAIAGKASKALSVCGTSACIAGWAALLTPPDEICLDPPFPWTSAGRESLGLADLETAEWVFTAESWSCAPPAEIAQALRHVASLPPERRMRWAILTLLRADRGLSAWDNDVVGSTP